MRILPKRYITLKTRKFENSLHEPYDRQNNVSHQDIHVLILRISEYMNLHGKRDFEDVTKSRIIRQGEYFELSRRVKCNYTSFYK